MTREERAREWLANMPKRCVNNHVRQLATFAEREVARMFEQLARHACDARFADTAAVTDKDPNRIDVWLRGLAKELVSGGE